MTVGILSSEQDGILFNWLYISSSSKVYLVVEKKGMYDKKHTPMKLKQVINEC